MCFENIIFIEAGFKLNKNKRDTKLNFFFFTISKQNKIEKETEIEIEKQKSSNNGCRENYRNLYFVAIFLYG